MRKLLILAVLVAAIATVSPLWAAIGAAGSPQNTFTEANSTGPSFYWYNNQLSTGDLFKLRLLDAKLTTGKYINLYGGAGTTSVWSVGEGGATTITPTAAAITSDALYLDGTLTTTGDAIQIKFVDATLNGGKYLNFLGGAGTAAVFTVAEDGVTAITSTVATDNSLTITNNAATTGDLLTLVADSDILTTNGYMLLCNAGASSNTLVFAVQDSGILEFGDGGTIDGTTGVDVLNLTETTIRATGILDVTGNSTLASADIGGGYSSTGLTVAATGALTGASTALFDSTITSGKVGSAGSVVIVGSTSGGITITPIAVGTSVATITNAAQTGAYSYTIPNAGSGYFGVSTAALTLAEMDVLDGVAAGTATASKAAVLGATKNLDTLVIADGGLYLGAGAGTAVTATAAEINLIDGSIAGTAVASKALSLGASKNIDTLVIADSGLYLGAGAGTAVTSTAAELNFLDTSVAGTAVASKAAVLGANKNLDTLVIADGGLYLGAVAGTAVTSTAAELNTLDGVAATLTAIELNTLDGVAATLTAAELNTLDGVAATLTAIELNTLDGVAATLTATELNTLDGAAATLTAIELNTLDGAAATLTATELNTLDGVAATLTAAELNILDGVTSTAAELNILDGVTSTAAELNILDGVTSTAAELNIVDGVTATAAEINVVAGGIARSELTEDALQVYGIPLYSLRQADMAAMGITETAGDHYTDVSANVIRFWGEAAISETEVSVSYFQFVIPAEYVAAGDCKIRIKHQVTGAGTNNGSTVDIEVYEQTGNGAVGADLVTTAATASTKDVWATTDFVVTAAGLVAGDILNVKVTTSCIENAAASLQSQVDGLAVLLDVKG